MTAAAVLLASLVMMSGVAAAQEVPPAGPQTAPAQAAPSEPAESFDLARLKIDQCPGERFDFEAAGQTKVGLCSKAGASNEEIAKMLESAIGQLEATDRMRAEARDQLIAQIRAKIAEVRAR